MGRRIQARLLLLLGLGAIGPGLGLIRAASDAQARFDEALSAERRLRAAEISARIDDRLAVELAHLRAAAARGGSGLDQVTAGRRSLIVATSIVDAQGHSAGVPSRLIEEVRQGSAATFARVDERRVWAIVRIERWDRAFAGAVAAELDLAP